MLIDVSYKVISMSGQILAQMIWLHQHFLFCSLPPNPVFVTSNITQCLNELYR